MKNKHQYGFLDLYDYILDKLNTEEKKNVKQAIDDDSSLAEMYEELLVSVDKLKYIEELTTDTSADEQRKKMFFLHIQRPAPAPGQVWEFKTGKYAYILSVSEEKFAHCVLLTNKGEVTREYDIIFPAPDVSFRPLALHTDHLFTLQEKDLKQFKGEPDTLAKNIIALVLQGQKPELPDGYEYGYGIDHSEVDIWNEYISEILEEFHSEALEKYEELMAEDNKPENVYSLTLAQKFKYEVKRLAEALRSAGPEPLVRPIHAAAHSGLILPRDFTELASSRETSISYFIPADNAVMQLRIVSVAITGVLQSFYVVHNDKEVFSASEIPEIDDCFTIEIASADIVDVIAGGNFTFVLNGNTHFVCRSKENE